MLISGGCCLNTLGAQTTANASFSPEVVETGDTFALRVLVGGTKVVPKAVDFTPWKTYFPPDNILKRYAWQRSGNQWVQQVTLIAFDSATLQLPPLSVITHLGDTLLTNSMQLRIAATPAQAEVNSINGIRDIRHTEGINWGDLWPIPVVLAVILTFWLWYLRSKRVKPAPAPPVLVATVAPIVSAYETAQQALENMAHEKPWKRDPMAFYIELSLVMRRYFEAAHGIPAPETTTRETVLLLKKAGFPKELIRKIQSVLQHSDLVKYAHSETAGSAHEKNLETAIQILNEAHQPPSTQP